MQLAAGLLGAVHRDPACCTGVWTHVIVTFSLGGAVVRGGLAAVPGVADVATAAIRGVLPEISSPQVSALTRE